MKNTAQMLGLKNKPLLAFEGPGFVLHIEPLSKGAFYGWKLGPLGCTEEYLWRDIEALDETKRRLRL